MTNQYYLYRGSLLRALVVGIVGLLLSWPSIEVWCWLLGVQPAAPVHLATVLFFGYFGGALFEGRGCETDKSTQVP